MVYFLSENALFQSSLIFFSGFFFYNSSIFLFYISLSFHFLIADLSDLDLHVCFFIFYPSWALQRSTLTLSDHPFPAYQSRRAIQRNFSPVLFVLLICPRHFIITKTHHHVIVVLPLIITIALFSSVTTQFSSPKPLFLWVSQLSHIGVTVGVLEMAD